MAVVVAHGLIVVVVVVRLRSRRVEVGIGDNIFASILKENCLGIKNEMSTLQQRI